MNIEAIIQILMMATVSFLFYLMGYKTGFSTGKRHTKNGFPPPEQQKSLNISELKEALLNASLDLKVKFGSAEKQYNLGLIGDDEFERVCWQINEKLNNETSHN